MVRNLFLSAVIGALAVSVVACGDNSTAASAESQSAPAPAPIIDVPVVRVTVGTIESALEISGTLAPRTRVGVKPKLPGRLERVLVDIGDRVTSGQVIATIDQRQLDAQVDAALAAVAVAEAAIENAEAGLANAKSEHARAKALFDGGAIPRQRLEAAETADRAGTAQRNLAKANLAQAQASLRHAREIQRDATLVSPMAGFIVERHYDAGAIPGDLPVVVVADLRQLKLEAGVSELEAGRLRTGLPAVVSVQAKPGEQFHGQLAAIAPEVDAQNRHFRIDIRVDNARNSLLAGMYATARIVLRSADQALTVPREAVTTVDGKRVAFKVTGDAVAAVPLTEGLTDGRRIQILSGLTAGEQVLADARRQVPAGSRVKAVVVN